jgi:hypothetical protein
MAELSADRRTLTRAQTRTADGVDVAWAGQSTARPDKQWDGPNPEVVIHAMNGALGPQPDSAYQVVEGTAG